MNASSEPIRIGSGNTMLATPANQHPWMIVMRFRDVGPRMATWSPGTSPRACNEAPTTLRVVVDLFPGDERVARRRRDGRADESHSGPAGPRPRRCDRRSPRIATGCLRT